MNKPRSVDTIKAELKKIESRRFVLLEELRLKMAQTLLPNLRLKLDYRTYPNTAEKRIALFEKLFVARADIYPRYWENKQTGRKGYSPVITFLLKHFEMRWSLDDA